MPKRYDQAEVAKIRQGLAEAPTRASPQGMTTRELVRELAGEIRELVERRSYTIPALAEYLASLDVEVSVPTLGQYLRDEGVRSGRRARGAAETGRKNRTSSGARRAPATASGETASGETAPGRPAGGEAASRAPSDDDDGDDEFGKSDQYRIG